MSIVKYDHLDLDANGQPVIAGTRIKVRMIVLDGMTHGWDPRELHKHHPDLTLGQIRSALEYYSDNKEAMDRDIQARLEHVEELRAAQVETPGRRKLRRKGLLP
ncbi:DUF433 domain-containing protein [Aquisphaera insulae]|uniref:DUF433 domain-containing protein n=1 Tax=Aquisphaera insulae TaxID=2712864 RepID=UPI0013EB820D|nr:DUF433 domain-containing protein [Aquisphaera insulae]